MDRRCKPYRRPHPTPPHEKAAFLMDNRDLAEAAFGYEADYKWNHSPWRSMESKLLCRAARLRLGWSPKFTDCDIFLNLRRVWIRIVKNLWPEKAEGCHESKNHQDHSKA